MRGGGKIRIRITIETTTNAENGTSTVGQKGNWNYYGGRGFWSGGANWGKIDGLKACKRGDSKSVFNPKEKVLNSATRLAGLPFL